MITIIIIAASFIGVACLVGGVASVMFRSESATAVENRLDVLTGAAQPAAKKQAEANLLASPLNDVPSVLEEFVLKFFNLRAFLQQADTQLSPTKFIIISVGL